MKPAISQVCTLHAPFEQDLADYAAAQCRAIEIWLGKLETYLETHSLDDVRRLVDAHQVRFPAASYQGGLFVREGPPRDATWQHFARRLELCRQLNISTLVVANDMASPLEQADLERAQRTLVEAARLAGEADVRLAFEFQAQAAFGNNLQTAAAMLAECNEPNLGLCLDLFHYYVGPSKPDDLGYLSRENLFHVQLSDLAGQPRELASDADRILPGDGDFLLEQILAALAAIGYEGHVSLELMNPQIWQINPQQVAEIGLTALRKVLGQARMS